MNFGLFSRFAVCTAALIVLLTPAAKGQLANRVLIVYNSTQPDSLEVAEHYRVARGIPTANMCAISSADVNDVQGVANYQTIVRDPVRACINTLGAANILYVVMSYLTPYKYFPQVPGTGPYALDSFVSDVFDRYTTQLFTQSPTGVHGYYADVQAKGNFFPPFVSLATYRVAPKATQIYSVFRLDGPTKEIAKGLVTRAIQAEINGGVTGRACFDLQADYGSPAFLFYPDSGSSTGNWDLLRASDTAAKLGFTKTTDTNEAEFGEGSVPPCTVNPDQTSFFAGWYSLQTYRDAFVWAPGSVGYHMESLGAYNLRAGQYWVPQALTRGITVTNGAIEEPFLQGLPRAAGVYRDLLVGANAGDAFLRNTRWLKWRVLNVGDPLYRPFPSAPLAPLAAENSLQIVARDVVGGQTAKGTLTIPAPAPAGGTTFTLTSNAGPPALQLPPNVTILQGLKTVTFNIATGPATALVSTPGISATSGAVTVSNSIHIYSLISRVVLTASSVTGGQSLQGQVQLNDRAPSGGVVVQLQSNSGAATPSSSVTIPAGSAIGNFVVNTTAVGSPTAVVITGTLQGVQATANLTVNP